VRAGLREGRRSIVSLQRILKIRKTPKGAEGEGNTKLFLKSGEGVGVAVPCLKPTKKDTGLVGINKSPCPVC